MCLKDNVATLYFSPGYDKFHAFYAEADLADDEFEEPITCFECTSVLEDEIDADLDEFSINLSFPLRLHNPEHDYHFNNGVDDTLSS